MVATPINYKKSRSDAFCVLILSVIMIASWIPRFSGPIDLRWDAGVYYVLGTSLAEGKGYRLCNEPGEIRAVQYPPGLPALVALEQIALHSNDPVLVGRWIRVSWCLLSVAYIICTFLLGRLFLPHPYAFLLSAACLLNYEMYFVSTLCFAELPYAFSSTLFGYLFFKKSSGALTRFLAPLAAVASYLMRSIGVALLIAWVADAAFRKQYRHMLVRAIVALIPVILWQSYIHSVESGESYRHPYYSYQRDASMFYNVSYARNVSLKSPFQPEQGLATKRDLINRFIKNLVAMPHYLGEAVSAKEGFWKGHITRVNRLIRPLALPSWVSEIVLVYLGLLVVAGVAWHLLCREWLIPIYVLLTVAGVCMTTWSGQFPRYLAPAEPFLLIGVLSFLLGIKRLSRFGPRRLHRLLSVMAIATVSMVVGESLISCVVGYRNFRDKAVYVDANGITREYVLFHYPGAASASEKGLEWLVAHADPHAVVAVSMPQWVYLKTGLKAVMPPLDADPFKAQREIDTVPATYVVVDQLLMEDDFNSRFPALVRQSPDKWRLVYPSPHGEFDIYQRVESNPNAKLVLGQHTKSGSLRF